MAIKRELLGHNEAWSSYSLVPMEGQLPNHTTTIPYQNVDPGIMEIIEKQQTTINACMAQVSD